MKLTDFDYHLPEVQIAYYPAETRDQSRLLVYDREQDIVLHKHFSDLLDYLTENDFLVINTTRVLKARLYGTKAHTGGKFELLLLKEIRPGVWESLVKPGRGMNVGVELNFEGFDISAGVSEVHPCGSRTLKFDPPERVFDLMDNQGVIPLPPYIQRKADELDSERYQTVYNNDPGSVAAPTAGLHFTDDILCKLESKGVEVVKIVLDIGWGTFAPVREKDPRNHKIETETYRIDKQAADRIVSLKKIGKKLIAIGTTSVRALESWYAHTEGKLEPVSKETNLFIYPSYCFKLVDKLVTNFHLPQSTLLMLVSAFVGREKILNLYNQAVDEGYRFFSYGDCMFIK